MKKVRLRNAEYMATLPPYRFAAGDVIEIEDGWAEQLVQRGIARKAPAHAQTVQEIRAEEREALVQPVADDRAARRAQLQAEMEALDREEAAQPYGGHFSDVITREDVGGAAPDEDDPKSAKAKK